MRDDMQDDRTDFRRPDAGDMSSAASDAMRNRSDAGPDGLMHLDDLDDYKVAEGEPDIRGWDVKTQDGTEIGDVEDLLVDTGSMKVRYIEVKLDKKLLNDDDDRYILFPIGTARLDDDDDDVYVNATANEIAAMPPYVRGSLDRDYERSLRDRFAGSSTPQSRTAAGTDEDFYTGETYDQSGFFGKRRAGREDAAYLTPSDMRMRPSGDIEVPKTVDSDLGRDPADIDESGDRNRTDRR